jgi:hypothetical protein
MSNRAPIALALALALTACLSNDRPKGGGGGSGGEEEETGGSGGSTKPASTGGSGGSGSGGSSGGSGGSSSAGGSGGSSTKADASASGGMTGSADAGGKTDMATSAWPLCLEPVFSGVMPSEFCMIYEKVCTFTGTSHYTSMADCMAKFRGGSSDGDACKSGHLCRAAQASPPMKEADCASSGTAACRN